MSIFVRSGFEISVKRNESHSTTAMTAIDNRMMVNHQIRKKKTLRDRSSSLTPNNGNEAASVVYATVSRDKRHFSPPSLPPCWGQDVAPPPTPFYTPQTSPGSSNGARMVSSLQRGNEVEVVNAGLYNRNSESIGAVGGLDTGIQRIDYQNRYHTQPQNRNKKLVKHRALNRIENSSGFGSTQSMHVHGSPQRSKRNPYAYQNAPTSAYCPENNEDDDLVLVRSDDVITYSYRFGKSGSINRYPINQVKTTLPISSSRSSLPNEGSRSKIRHRKKRRQQRLLNTVYPEELVTIEEIPFVQNYTGEDHFHAIQEQQQDTHFETHGRGYFVGDTKIYDNNLVLDNNNGIHYMYNDRAYPAQSHANYRAVSRSYKPVRPPPNSQSSSPIYTGSSGTSPEGPIANTQSNQHHPSSPASPDSNISSQSTVMIVNHCRIDRTEPYFPRGIDLETHVNGQIDHRGMSISSSTSSLTQTTIQRRSAMKMPSSNLEKYPRKTVQWLIDTKKRPDEISHDRKQVKNQVGLMGRNKYKINITL